VSSEGQRTDEDAERDRQDGALTEKGARTASDRNGGHGDDVPGGQLHFVRTLRVDAERRRFNARREAASSGRRCDLESSASSMSYM
jgi:hypothetical protein